MARRVSLESVTASSRESGISAPRRAPGEGLDAKLRARSACAFQSLERSVYVPAKRVVHFKPGRMMKEKVLGHPATESTAESKKS